MKRWLFVCSVLALMTVSPAVLQTRPAMQSGTAPQAAAGPSAEAQQALVKTYCATCHSTQAKAGGLALDGMNVQAAAEHPETWEKVIRKLRGRLMPPPGSKQPEQKEIDSLVGYLENTLDSQAAKGPKA